MRFKPDQEFTYVGYSPEVLSRIDVWLDTLEDPSYVATFRDLIDKFNETFHEIDNTVQALSMNDEEYQVDPYLLMLSYLAQDVEEERAKMRDIELSAQEAG